MPELVRLIREDAPFFKRFCYFGACYLLITSCFNNFLAYKIYKHNEKLGLGMSLDFGWRGVILTPIHPHRHSDALDLAEIVSSPLSLHTCYIRLSPW